MMDLQEERIVIGEEQSADQWQYSLRPRYLLSLIHIYFLKKIYGWNISTVKLSLKQL